jgi:hypothetical protein
MQSCKSKSVLLAVMLAALILFSCKKDKDDAPGFSATGYWRGYFSLGSGTSSIGILNRENGTCRLYGMIGSIDTATASEKVNGTYTMTGNFYRGIFPYSPPGDTIFFETTNILSYSMSGVVTLGSTGSTYFQIVKQP